MPSEPASVSLAPLQQRVDACDLCSVGPEALHTAVLWRHARGGSVQLRACDRCTAAVKRLIAVAGGVSASGPARVVLEPETAPVVGGVEAVTPNTVGQAVIAHEYAEPFRDEAGRLYVVRVYGQERADGTWIGWLMFIAADGETVRRTTRETTQSNREHLDYWATGLQPSYLEGAFRRAS